MEETMNLKALTAAIRLDIKSNMYYLFEGDYVYSGDSLGNCVIDYYQNHRLDSHKTHTVAKQYFND